jgi:VCBS repeat-containing protein
VLSADVSNLTETDTAGDISTAGMLTISDVDSPASFVAQAGTIGSYGTFAIDAAGAWTYTASSAHNEFAAGATYTDTFSVASADGTLSSVTINILGTNDAADTMFSTAHCRQSANVETLVLQGNADLQGYGNSDANTLYGNAGNNLLNGEAGADRMVGGAGNDTYFVDNSNDVVFENANEGNDAVFSTAHYRLSANVETLVLQGNADLQGYGNSDANTLYGNAGNNLLNGEAGADRMVGGAGNDTYFVDDSGDLVFENANEGTDAVFATVNYTLTANVETLVLQGAGDLSGTGNALDNKVYGNAGDNALNGGAGADMLNGGAGHDTLTGGTGNDTFVFGVGQADGDIIVDFDGQGAAAGDSLQFVGYGPGATFTQNDATHWQIDYNGGSSHELITFMNGAAIHASDWHFV